MALFSLLVINICPRETWKPTRKVPCFPLLGVEPITGSASCGLWTPEKGKCLSLSTSLGTLSSHACLRETPTPPPQKDMKSKAQRGEATFFRSHSPYRARFNPALCDPIASACNHLPLFCYLLGSDRGSEHSPSICCVSGWPWGWR